MQRITHLLRLSGYVFVCTLCIYACGKGDSGDPLEAALRRAGKNRAQLELVLKHYAGDTLKREAAIFLITHLDLQYTSINSGTSALEDRLMQTAGMSEAMANRFMDSIELASPLNSAEERSRTPDIQTITAEIFIENIDNAFIAWQSQPWKDSVGFRDFCNYILPYKCGAAQVQSWRSIYRDAGSEVLRPGMSMMAMVDTLLVAFRPQYRHINAMREGRDIPPVALLQIMAGQCYNWAYLTNYLLRSQGIPAAVLNAPQWATYSVGHAWNGILQADGKVLPYAIDNVVPYVFDPLRWSYKAGKIYMQAYERNPESFAMYAAERGIISVPSHLRDPRIIDVTAQCMRTVTLPVEILYPAPGHCDYLFLCVFGREKYEALDWTLVHDNQAAFNHVGVDIVCMPAWYIDKTYIPAADPVRISYDGDLHVLSPDTTVQKEVRLYRKFPMKNTMYVYTRSFIGMKIQASNDSTFSNAVNIHTITKPPSPVIADSSRDRDRWKWEEYRDSVVFEQPVRTRFVRMLTAPGTECIVGELDCVDMHGQQLHARAFGSAGNAAYVLDGFYGEAYRDPDPNGWIALDFGKPVDVARMRYMPSQDSNSIQKGDRYELYYWDRGWISLGVQVAAAKYLDYIVPDNALLWLKNLDRGKEERIFTIDPVTQEQVWW